MESLSKLCKQNPNDNNEIFKQLLQVIKKCEKQFDLKAYLNDEQQKTILNYSVPKVCSNTFDSQLTVLWFTVWKIISRTRTNLELLFQKSTINYLLQFAKQSRNEERFNDCISALHVLLNLTLIDRNKTQLLFVDQPVLITQLIETCWNVYDLTNHSNFRVVSHDITFTIVRIFLFLSLHHSIASQLVKQHKIYLLLAQTLIEISGYKSSSISSTLECDSENCSKSRKICAEVIKLICNMSMESASNSSPFTLPRPNQEILPTLYQQVTQHSTTSYDQYANVLCQILAIGTILPQSIQRFLNESTSRDSNTNSISTNTNSSQNSSQLNTARETKSPELPDRSDANQKSNGIQLDSLQLSLNSGENNILSADQTQLFDHPQLGQREQTTLVIEKIENESKESGNPNFVSLTELQADVANLLIYSHEQLLPYLSQNPASFHSLINLLHRALIITSKIKKQTESMLNPILTTLLECCKRSPLLSRHCKIAIFEEHAFKQPPSEYYKNETQQRMAPEGAFNERIIDFDPQSIKSFLLPLLTSLNYSIKQLTGELIFECCSKDSSEYIRLCGFGNAVGLLADKGLPGFLGLKEKAHNIDDLLKQGRKL